MRSGLIDFSSEVEPRDAPRPRLAAVDTVPTTEVDAGVPIAQGSIWIAGDALLEPEQRLQIDAVIIMVR